MNTAAQSYSSPSLPRMTWRMLRQRSGGEELAKGLDAVWDGAIGIGRHFKPTRRRFLSQAEQVMAMAGQFVEMTDARLQEETRSLLELYRRGRDKQEDLLRAFAMIREVASRQIGERPYLVQVAGGFALDSGFVAEMATGEGKTLTATMPAVVAGWRGRGCHVITVNDYLAKRDAEWMGKIYQFCGLSVAHIGQEMPGTERRNAYQADITYCTNKEVAADFLRDRLVLGRLRNLPAALLNNMGEGRDNLTGRLIMRGLEYAIIDEADSVLIDEAVTPLILSGDAPNPEQVDAFSDAARIVEPLESQRDYQINERYKEIKLSPAGKQRLGELTEPLGGLWRGARRREELATQALTARHFYTRDKQYVVNEDKIVIVDEFTGRLMPDRTWREGLHQAIEAKEGLTVNPPKDTYARVSFQRFFRLYRKLAGMTGTAAESWREFWQIYHLPVVVIPTNKPCVRKSSSDRVFAHATDKWNAIAEEIYRVHQTSRPILIGTRSVRASEHISKLLSDRGLEHQLLNAVRHAEEAQIVAGAGSLGKITVATNMAGRGTDIKLGRGVAELGGLHVIATERHEAGRVDRQLFGRCARQGDPGSAQAFVSLDDELVKRYATRRVGILRRGVKSGNDRLFSVVSRTAFNAAQRQAQRTALRQRKAVLRTDGWLDEHLGFAGTEQ